MADSGKNGTPLLDELEKGPWPSFVSESKSMAGENKMCKDLLGQLEKSYRDKIGYWKHGGIVGVMGYGGGVIGRYSFLATGTDELEPTFAELIEKDFDLGGSGSDMRTPSCCVGPARCEWACYDTLAFTQDVTQHYQDELHRPAFPYKFKIKSAGCPNDCVASIARADLLG